MNDQGTKYMKVASCIRGDILGGKLKEGQKIYSENELCQRWTVSRQTVRKALGILEEEGYIERRRGSGTYVKKQPVVKNPKSMAIGLICSRVDSYIFPEQTAGIEQVLSKHGYSLQLGIHYHKYASEAQALRAMLKLGVDGIILEPAKSAMPRINTELYDELKRREIPIVTTNIELPNNDFPGICLDDRKGGFVATQYLIEKGHRKIGGVFKLDDCQGHLRYAGFMDAMKESNIMYNENNVFWYSSEYEKKMFGGRFDDVLLDAIKGCSAVFCYNDEIADELISLLKRNHIDVPGKVSVIGCDNSPKSVMMQPALTTILHPSRKLGEIAANHLLKLIEDKNFSAGHIFEPELIERDSVISLSEEKL